MNKFVHQSMTDLATVKLVPSYDIFQGQCTFNKVGHLYFRLKNI